jgi:hypothetical protein
VSLGRLLLLAAALGPGPSDAVAQKTGTIIGIVADTNKTPIVDAEIVAIRSNITTLTDSRGIFILPGLPPGEEVFRIRRVGYRSELFDATIVANDTIKVGVVLAVAPFNLPEISVTVEGEAYTGKMVGFADRMLHSGAPRNAFLTRKDIEAMDPRPVVDMLIKAGMKRYIDRRGKEALLCPRGIGLGGSRVAVYVDGMLSADPTTVQRMDPSLIEAVEVYRSTANRPAEYNGTGATCVILVWTR